MPSEALAGVYISDSIASETDGSQCDKKKRNRGGLDDPCSECRWFGGDKCECTLAVLSYNDAVWFIMMNRGPRHHYTLPAPKDRTVSRKKKPDPSLMPSDRLKADWAGKTRDQLLALPDMLPEGVRDLPRAYVVPPRETNKGPNIANVAASTSFMEARSHFREFPPLHLNSDDKDWPEYAETNVDEDDKED